MKTTHFRLYAKTPDHPTRFRPMDFANGSTVIRLDQATVFTRTPWGDLVEWEGETFPSSFRSPCFTGYGTHFLAPDRLCIIEAANLGWTLEFRACNEVTS